jgi:uncharacterized pyridoxamine 5'-phosphate oxidase family protein
VSRSYEFLQECEVFFVLTVDQQQPAGRPFGAVMEVDEKLYFSTATQKAVYRQLVENAALQIVALKAGTREWIRINGKAVERTDRDIKQQMLEACPVLAKHFTSPDCLDFAVFEVAEKEASLNINSVFVKVD